ncbi:hypothetical protein [Streptomyces sp. MI02-7b]|uniref:hypothetical protein n=1 Tax=Streptomyces sp. MI02-7b TaxID=462941 RepID=UPI0029B89037|nr:hypothetical protein [Streptomyces sp. MI02-7b]MDX3075538.1 hypothetical protein [Streptomyces sp. MI02-7b]
MILAVSVLLLAGTAWRLHRYPGGWSYAFSGRHDTDRHGLDRERRAVRELRGRARRELAVAEGRVAQAEQSYRSRISAAERRLRGLRTSGNGALLSALGHLSLHEHVVVISGPGAKVLPLGGVQVQFEHSPMGHHIYLRRPDGVHWESYATGEHSEDSVRRFSVRIENQVAKENRFLAERAASVKKAEDALKEARADTRPADRARRHLSAVTARQSRDRALDEALTRLETAQDRWQRLTGRRPPR